MSLSDSAVREERLIAGVTFDRLLVLENCPLDAHIFDSFPGLQLCRRYFDADANRLLSELFTVSGSRVAVLKVLAPRAFAESPTSCAAVLSLLCKTPVEILILSSIDASALSSSSSAAGLRVLGSSKGVAAFLDDVPTLECGNVVRGLVAALVCLAEERDWSALAILFVARHKVELTGLESEAVWTAVKTFLRRSSAAPPASHYSTLSSGTELLYT